MTRPLILDTNVLIALFKGDQGVAKVVSAYEKVLVPTIVLGEFKAGTLLDARNGKLANLMLARFLDEPSVEVVEISESVADAYARVFKVLREAGTPIPQNDLWIAAAAVDRGAALFSRDAHFSVVPLLERIDALI